MGHACLHVDPHVDPDPAGEREHPATALLAVAAILLAMLLITWAALEIHGTAQLDAVVEQASEGSSAPPQVDSRTEEERERDAAVVSNRWATGLGH
jgi:hypothetical protein